MSATLQVLVPTFRHGAFISQTLDGCLLQQTDFEVEILVSDDGSDDHTAAVVQAYQQRFPEKIKAFLHKQNLGPAHPRELGGKNNVLFLFGQATAPLLALCEGDDYWTDPHKLQRQVDFLHNSPDAALCFHNVQVVYEDGSPPHPFHGPLQEWFEVNDLLQGTWLVPTCSTVFRNVFQGGFPGWFHRMAGGDLGIFLLAAAHGRLHYDPAVQAVYRRHSGGQSLLHTPGSRFFLQNRRAFYQEVDSWFSGKYSTLLQQTTARLDAQLAALP